uniref:RNase H type-1 domain-containing protein n=1 Tax=Cannabis sativa TaxID=3483 RepID=A0A803P367_CANSA
MDAARFEIDKFNGTNDFSLGDEVLREVSSEDKALSRFGVLFVFVSLCLVGVLSLLLIHDLKTGYMLERVVRRAGDYVGKLVKADTKNFNGIWREYLRVRATIDIEKPLKHRMKLCEDNGDWIWENFKYEHVPTFYFVWAQWLRSGTEQPEPVDGGRRGSRPGVKSSATAGLRIMEIDYDNKGEEIVSMNSGKNKGVILGNNDNNGDDSEGENSGKKEGEVAVSDDELLMVLDSKRRRTEMEHASCATEEAEKELGQDVIDQLCVAIGFDGAISVNARDLNNVTSRDDKRGGNPYPNWLVNGFNDALGECGLCDMELYGYPYTWERHRGTDDWVEVRIDRALVNQSWLDLFPTAKLFNLEASNSDHCPLHLVPHNATMVASNRVFRKRFFWKQRSKQLWLREGNSNSKYFHATATARRRKNSIQKMKNAAGVWFDLQNGLDSLVSDYFSQLFSPTTVNFSEILHCTPVTVTPENNAMLVELIMDDEVRRALFQMHSDKSPGPMVLFDERRFVTLVMTCVSTVTYNVVHGGHSMGPILPERDVQLILSIQLSDSTTTNSWYWKMETSSFYSVKSSYNHLQVSSRNFLHLQDESYWKKLWKLDVPPKVLHFLWRACSGCLPTKAAIMLVWMISVAGFSWFWMVIKVRCSKRFGFGCVARNPVGHLLEAISDSRIGMVLPEIAEIIGMMEALSWIKRKGWEDVIIETDSSMVVQALNSSVHMSSYFGLLVEDCRLILSTLKNVLISFVYRSANKAPHCLARESCYLSGFLFNELNAPTFLKNIVIAEAVS